LLYIDGDGRAISLGPVDQPDRVLLALAIDPRGDLWIATSIGLYRLPGAVPGPLERVVIPGVPANARFSSLTVVGDQLWTGAAPGGAAVLDHGAWRVFDDRDGLRAPAAYYVISRASGRMCVGYPEALGVSCFRRDGRGIH